MMPVPNLYDGGRPHRVLQPGLGRRASRTVGLILALGAISMPLSIVGCDSKPQVVSGDGTGKAKRDMVKRYQDSFQYKGKKPVSPGSSK